MSLLKYLAHKCECCGVKIPMGSGFFSLFSFFLLCDECAKAPCVRHIFPKPVYWIHRGETA